MVLVSGGFNVNAVSYRRAIFAQDFTVSEFFSNMLKIKRKKKNKTNRHNGTRPVENTVCFAAGGGSWGRNHQEKEEEEGEEKENKRKGKEKEAAL